ncbi:hypothetical protein U9M48_003557 [Paspalum notatum var. saurae]|uniref:Reverse transcriptase zinc-binding domain-containing protein n=1 Tax=Paspalum notatum var. saurae TaxID=547442 RepID=A0AAQ3PTN4_PASNO
MSGSYSCKSAYSSMFTGTVRFSPWKRIWRSWAPPNCRFFIWLAVNNKCWTSDRLAKKGLPHQPTCPLCDQEAESINHLLSGCVLSREVWAWLLRELKLNVLPPTSSSRFCSWWKRTATSLEKSLRKGFNSLVILVSWELWKHRNACVFDGVRPQAQTVLTQVAAEGHLWCLARALGLHDLLLRRDFNLIYQAADKNNNNLNRALMGRFRHFLDDMQIKEVPLLGQKFTWSNEQDNPTLVRLDRAFCSLEWEEIFPDAVLQSSTAGVSNHCPLILGLKVSSSGKRRFHFESFWPNLPGFHDAVKLNWEASVSSSCPVERVFLKLQRLSRGLQKWSHRKVGNVKMQLAMAKEVLRRLEVARDLRALSQGEDWLRKKLKLHCLGLASLERTIARLRSRVLFLKEGDANTSFFHQQARYRKKKSFISKLQVDDNLYVSQEDKQEVVADFFESLLGSSEERDFSFDLAAFHTQQQQGLSPWRSLSQPKKFG